MILGLALVISSHYGREVVMVILSRSSLVAILAQCINLVTVRWSMGFVYLEPSHCEDLDFSFEPILRSLW